MDFPDLCLDDEYASSVSSGSPPNVISKVEATFYHAGISRSPRKLVYRTPKDPFVMPKGPEAYRRLKHLYPVYDHKLGNKWEDVRPEVRDLLDKQQVRFSTIDLGPTNACYYQSRRDLGRHSSRYPRRRRHRTPGIGIQTLSWCRALRTRLGPGCNQGTSLILSLLRLDFLLLPRRRPTSKGTMGFYFKDGDDLLRVTARHVLFPADEDNSDYTYNPSGPHKEVLLMGIKAWDDYLKSVQIQIGNLGIAAEIHEESIGSLERAAELLEETTDAINELQKLYEQTKKDFGTEIEAAKFVNKMYPRTDTQPGFKVPSRTPPQDILTEDRMRHPDTKDHDGENCLYVIKRGLTTLTTIGRATGFFSYVREYFANQIRTDNSRP
ncbi:hypothetical protein J3R82DRAFT_96 [Butyriboletus roseoflavus]|nr:hypothetical protein J3R82DRAFT_96 [Butyriboletus roseoflavus]